jgi:hypothetical protein
MRVFSVTATGPSTLQDILLRRNVTSSGGNAEVAVTEKTLIGVGVKYERTDYRQSYFSDTDIVTVPFNYYYELTPKIDVSAGYEFRSTWQQIYADSYDSFYNVGVRGELTPKLSGNINVGITDRHYHGKIATLLNLGNQTLPGIESSLTYAVSPKATLSLGVNNEFDVNAQGYQDRNLSVLASGTFNLTEEWIVSAALAYRNIQYKNNFSTAFPDHTDDYIEGQLGVTYKVNAIVSFTAAGIYRNNHSSISSFDENVLSLAANFRY